ncbi:MAG TPA: AmmeMemoRadiSam system protein B, partial [Gammaproteobacteria bacterium]|nr:AmmeMemoRadiSam system protein B [Gammaproteobacteria bacterium]
MLETLLNATPRDDRTPPKAMILPHAGYIYSGPVAATGYARLRSIAKSVHRVVVMGPSHRVAFQGLAVPEDSIFRTPLGDIELDTDTIQKLRSLPQVRLDNKAHRLEHSIEVHLPFLQEVLEHFVLVPIVVGDATPLEVSEVISLLWDDPETLLIVSSDLSHYHDYDTAT